MLNDADSYQGGGKAGEAASETVKDAEALFRKLKRFDKTDYNSKGQVNWRKEAREDFDLTHWQPIARTPARQSTRYLKGFMPLTRGMIVGYDVEKMTLRFTMVDGSARIVDCAISGSALDQLGGERQSADPADRQIQFQKHRDTIEELASALFDARVSARPVLVEIFAKHIRGRQDRSGRLRGTS